MVQTITRVGDDGNQYQGANQIWLLDSSLTVRL